MIDTLSEIGVERSRMTLWQRGLDNKLFSPQRKDIATIRSITKNSNKNILFASRLVWEKNLDVLIQIYQEINQRKLPYNLIIAGDGVARQDLERRMPGAHFLGHQTHESLAMLYASSDYFVFPSTTETYGNVIVESMASGLPCVIADAGGSGSLVRHGETGMLCDPNDPKDYLNKIQLLEEHPDLRYRMIEAGLVFTQPLHWDRLAEQYYHYV
ncbi:MAG: glycosyltransferase, partial [Bacteroidota bacterium]